MYRVYFAGDLFDHKHITGNRALADQVEKESHGLYQCKLPQEYEVEYSSTIEIRNTDIKSVIRADCVIMNFDGTDLDSGTVVEYMVAKMLDIPAVLLRTDAREGGYFGREDWNLMVSGFPRTVVVKHNAWKINGALGIPEMHRVIAGSVIKGFDEARSMEPILKTTEDVYAAYKHVIKMCGSDLEALLPEVLLHEIIASKMAKGMYRDTCSLNQGARRA